MPTVKRLLLLICAVFALALHAEGQSNWSLGPLYDSFPLTLDPGRRTEIAGPLYYSEKKDTQELWSCPPLFSYVQDPDVELEEFDFLYPLITYDRYGAEYRLQLLQLLSLAGGNTQEEIGRRRFTLFPFYFQQRSAEPDSDYTAVFPLYGTLKNRLFRDKIHFVMFPLYVKSWKKDIVTANYVFPFFHLRQGDALSGWQFWPLVGHEEKDITTKTNRLDEVEPVGGHDKRFVLWPFFLKTHTDIGTDNPQKLLSIVPLYVETRSPQRDSTSYGWPLGVTITDDRVKNFHEVGAPWPLVVFTRGVGKHTTRFWPLFSRASNTNLESNFYLWPVYKYNRLHSDPLDRERTRILFFLYSDIIEKNTQTGDFARRQDLWPFFTKRRDLSGNERLQILSLLEPILPNNKSIERNYSHLWSLWRSEKNVKSSSTSQSLLWNLYRRDASPAGKKISALFGLFQYQQDAEGKKWRLFYIPVGQKRAASVPLAKGKGEVPLAPAGGTHGSTLLRLKTDVHK